MRAYTTVTIYMICLINLSLFSVSGFEFDFKHDIDYDIVEPFYVIKLEQQFLIELTWYNKDGVAV